MSGHGKKTIRKRWEKIPYCFWCGVETVWTEQVPHRPLPDNAATCDHIRSRFCNARAQGDNWHQGICVLACNRCNRERSAIENEWMLCNRPDEFRAKNGSRPAEEVLIKTQSRLATMVIALFRNDGKITGPEKLVRRIVAAASRLKHLYLDKEHNGQPASNKVEAVQDRTEAHEPAVEQDAPEAVEGEKIAPCDSRRDDASKQPIHPRLLSWPQ